MCNNSLKLLKIDQHLVSNFITICLMSLIETISKPWVHKSLKNFYASENELNGRTITLCVAQWLAVTIDCKWEDRLYKLYCVFTLTRQLIYDLEYMGGGKQQSYIKASLDVFYLLSIKYNCSIQLAELFKVPPQRVRDHSWLSNEFPKHKQILQLIELMLLNE